MKILFITNDLNFKLGADIIAGFPKTDAIAVVSLLTSGPQKKTLEQLGVTVTEIDFLERFKNRFSHNRLIRAWLFVWNFRKIVSEVQKVITEFEPDVVHTNLWLSDIVGITAAKKVGIKKIFSTQHDAVSINFFAKLYKIQLLKKVSHVIAISKNVADFAHAYFRVPEEKIKIIKNGIDFTFFSNSIKPDEEWKPVVGQVGRLEKIKGQIFLLQALKQIKESENISLETILVGSGKDDTMLKNYTQQNNLTVEFIPLTPDIRPWLKKIDILVVPSLDEGFGVVVIEGLAAKKLVIASNTGGIPEILEHKKNGILINSPLDEGIAKALLWALRNKNEACKLREDGYRWIIENKNIFSIETTSSEYRKLFAN